MRRRCAALFLIFLVLTGVGLAVPHLKAWYHYRAGKTALERYHAVEALGHLNACLRTWPESKDARLLAARAARRADRLDEAVAHLEGLRQALGNCGRGTAGVGFAARGSR